MYYKYDKINKSSLSYNFGLVNNESAIKGTGEKYMYFLLQKITLKNLIGIFILHIFKLILKFNLFKRK